MEINSVTLDLEKYNEMRDFNQYIIDDCSVAVFWSYNRRESVIYTEHDAVKEIAEVNVKLKSKINELRKVNQTKSIYDDIKNISLWDFVKLKYKNKN